VEFDALIVVSFGGPEGPDDVMPFLQNVVRGRPVPPERLEKVAAQYARFGGVSPINEQNRRLVTRLRSALAGRGQDLPVYWGNRNWHPHLDEAIAQMRDDGIGRAAAFVTSAYSSYSSCRQYIEDIDAARARVGLDAPEVTKLRPFFNHPEFVEPLVDGLREALKEHPDAAVLMTAHSLPKPMAGTSDYEQQLQEVAALVAQGAGAASWQVVFQSRSGPPGQPWLEPDINDAIGALPAGTKTAVVVPIGFVSDHMEVVHDLDLVAAQTARNRNVELVRTATPGADPRFVEMILDLLAEAEDPTVEPKTVGTLPASAFPCRTGCCPPGSVDFKNSARRT
jgi:ferrochelatase